MIRSKAVDEFRPIGAILILALAASLVAVTVYDSERAAPNGYIPENHEAHISKKIVTEEATK